LVTADFKPWSIWFFSGDNQYLYFLLIIFYLDLNCKAIELETTPIYVEFLQHLKEEGNDRILFSGTFGSGKTTFLDDFAQNVDDFIFIKLIPVNYSIASNEEVFELIKYDLLIEILNDFPGEVNLQSHEFPVSLIAQFFFLDKAKNIPFFGSLTAELVELINKDSGLEEIVAFGAISSKLNKSISGLWREWKKFSSNIQHSSEENKLTQYIESQKSTIEKYEGDSTVNLIRTLINRIKSNKKSVLIIDDLDRLDPDHIFRLFNIFSSQYDIKTNQNKFGFDKVIFVCDLDNIRNIYYHKYGSKVDFSGYIDKFYSTIPFSFNLNKFVSDTLRLILSQIPFSTVDKSITLSQYADKNSEFSVMLQSIILNLIDARRLNLRKLFQFPEIEVPMYTFPWGATRENPNYNYPILIMFNFLYGFYGSWSVISDNLKQLANHFHTNSPENVRHKRTVSPYNIDKILISRCLPFILDDGVIFGGSDTLANNQELSGNSKLLNCKIKYFLEQGNFYYTSALVQPNVLIELNAYDVVHKAFDECLRRNVLKFSYQR
jgi:hypothetical protein